ncbi:MAG: BamA/TamA family outer membrane protein [Bacteroidota bacterium]
MWRFFLLFALSLPLAVQAQEAGQVVVDTIEIKGDSRTRVNTILRELTFSQGDTIEISELPETLERNRRQVLNLSLFTRVGINVGKWDDRRGRISVVISVSEAWYIYPFPIFELADRNFNIWWVEQNRSFDRVNFGVRFFHINFTGRGDVVKLISQLGYTQKFELQYLLPSFNKSQTLGLRANFFYSRNKEIFHNTIDNRQAFERVNDFQLQRRRITTALIYRPKIYTLHEWGAEYYHNSTTPFVAQELNPDFFLDGRTSQRYLSLKYAFSIDRRDYRPYPLKGFHFRTTLVKDGLGVYGDRDALTLTTTYANYAPLGRRFTVETILKGHLFFIRKQQPFYNSRALGFEPDFLRGYEYYLVDGQDYGYVKSSFRYEIFNGEINYGRYMPLKKMRIMPLRVYLSVNNDLGYVYNPHYSDGNSMANRLLWGRGIGLDLITYNDKVWQIQYTFNHLGEAGLFLHYKFIL